MLVDSDVLIWHLRGLPRATQRLDQLPVTPAITLRAVALMESLSLSHGLGMGDALIVATALEHGLPLLTANFKHFSPVEGLTIERFEPMQDAGP